MIGQLMTRSLMNVLSPRGPRGQLSILIFHRVLPRPDPLFPLDLTQKGFDETVTWTKGLFNILPLQDAVEQLRTGSLPARAACITFDDGYADNYLYALPVLQRHGATATFFVATGFLNGGRMWNDTLIESIRHTSRDSINLTSLGMGTLATGTLEQKRFAIEKLIATLKYRRPDDREASVESVAQLSSAELPNDLMLSSEQLRGLRSAGMTIGAHTVSHPILARCSADTARREIEDSRAQLEAVLGERVTLFAYPNGKLGEDYMPEHARLVRESGFDAAVSTNPGASRHGDDLFQLRRFTPWARRRWHFAFRMAKNLVPRR